MATGYHTYLPKHSHVVTGVLSVPTFFQRFIQPVRPALHWKLKQEEEISRSSFSVLSSHNCHPWQICFLPLSLFSELLSSRQHASTVSQTIPLLPLLLLSSLPRYSGTSHYGHLTIGVTLAQSQIVIPQCKLTPCDTTTLPPRSFVKSHGWPY